MPNENAKIYEFNGSTQSRSRKIARANVAMLLYALLYWILGIATGVVIGVLI